MTPGVIVNFKYLQANTTFELYEFAKEVVDHRPRYITTAQKNFIKNDRFCSNSKNFFMTFHKEMSYIHRYIFQKEKIIIFSDIHHMIQLQPHMVENRRLPIFESIPTQKTQITTMLVQILHSSHLSHLLQQQHTNE